MKVILFNPRSARAKHRIPNSILQVAASIHGKYEYALVDGNLEKDPWRKIEEYLQTGFNVFGCTVMPGPQLKQAIPFTLKVREKYPEVLIVWGGYFAANQFSSVLNSNVIDFVINGPGDDAFPRLLGAIDKKEKVEDVPNLIFKKGDEVVKTAKALLADQDTLPQLP